VNNRELFVRLLKATNTKEAIDALAEFRRRRVTAIDERPVGYRPNNRGTIEVATDPGRSVIERITNAVDALLELEHYTHQGGIDYRSPREAAEAWLGVDPKGLGSMTLKRRQDLAHRIVVTVEPGGGKESRIVTVRDTGIGLDPAEIPRTILSLNESNKWQKHYLAGTFGQGGSSTFAFSELTLVASRRYRSNKISFTAVWYKDLPSNEYKSGHYVYVVENQLPLVIPIEESDILVPQGTVVRHFGYDLTNYSSPFGERSLYGAMNRLLFDPVSPVWYENKVDGWNRGIYGSRTRLNSGSEDAEGGNKIDLDHQMPLFSINLGDLGNIKLEYWVLPIPEKRNTVPVAAYVDQRKPIILSINGQNQSELSAVHIRKDAELPYLRTRLVCHIDCNDLSSTAKRSLFASTREQAKEGQILARIRDEIIEALKSDDELVRLNREAKEKSLSDSDEESKKRLQKEVARMLTLMGKAQIDTDKASQKGAGASRAGTGGGRKKVKPLETREPPTYIKILRDEDQPITFHETQRRWLRIETDATSDYHDPARPQHSKINLIVGAELRLVGTSALRGGRMRVAVECLAGVGVGKEGQIKIELHRKNLSTITDEARYRVIEKPKPDEKKRIQKFPDFRLIEVKGPEDENWKYITERSIDIAKHSSAAELDEGTLLIYYSSHFPKFSEEFSKWSKLDTHKAASFQRRYEVWIAVHSLLLHEQEDSIEADVSEDVADEFFRQERCRFSAVAAMIANQEVKSGDLKSEEDEA
jgi:hypothetical protein